MTKWTAGAMPAMDGRTVVITGASGGLGLVAAREMARAGAHVVLAVRNVTKGEQAAAGIAGSTEVRHLDVADLGSVRSFAAEWTADMDILINNAGIMEVPLARTGDGFESQMATNYFGPFVLTNLLLPHITDRIVSVSSQLHRMGKIHLDDLNFDNRQYRAVDAYNDSKLALVLFSLELQSRLTAAGRPVRSMLAHPGIASTGLASHTGAGKVTRALRFLFNDSSTGALSILFAATQDIPGNSYVGPRGLASMKGHPRVGRPAKSGLDASTASKLWSQTAQLTGAGLTEPSTP